MNIHPLLIRSICFLIHANQIKLLASCFLSFLSFGLQSQFQWKHTDGPMGSAVSALYANDSFLFAPEIDFLYRSHDGMTWEKLDAQVGSSWGINNQIMASLFRDSLKEIKISLSLDQGEHWEFKNAPVNLKSGSIAVSTHGIYITEGSQSKLYRSQDLADSWDTLSPPFLNAYEIASFDDVIYLYNSSEIWRMDNAASTWEKINNPVRNNNNYIDDVLVTGSNIFITGEKYIFSSQDYGNSWRVFETHRSNNPFKIALTKDEVFVFSYELYRSQDFGETWEIIATAQESPSITQLTGFKGQMYVATYNQGVFRWNAQNRNFVENNDGLSKGVVYDLSYGNDLLWAACGNGIFSYNLKTNLWNPKMNLPLPDFQFYSISSNDHSWVAAYKDYGPSFYLSLNQGLEWKLINPKLNGMDINSDRVQFLDRNILLFELGRVYLSKDSGVIWRRLDIEALDQNVVTFKGKAYILSYDKIYSSKDHGENWTSEQIGFGCTKLFATQDFLFTITLQPNKPVSLFASSDGVNWNEVGDGLPQNDFFIDDPFYIFQDKSNFYIFWGYHGLYVSSDALLSWELLKPGFYGNAYLALEDAVFLGKEGVYKSTILEPYMTNTLQIDKSNNLGFIYPNPATDRIFFQTNKYNKHTYQLQIANLNGELLFDKRIKSTELLNDLSLFEFQSGIYYVKLIDGNKFQINRLIVLKQE